MPKNKPDAARFDPQNQAADSATRARLWQELARERAGVKSAKPVRAAIKMHIPQSAFYAVLAALLLGAVVIAWQELRGPSGYPPVTDASLLDNNN